MTEIEGELAERRRDQDEILIGALASGATDEVAASLRPLRSARHEPLVGGQQRMCGRPFRSRSCCCTDPRRRPT